MLSITNSGGGRANLYVDGGVGATYLSLDAGNTDIIAAKLNLLDGETGPLANEADVDGVLGAIFSGQIRDIPSTTAARFGSIVGISSATTDVSIVETLSSHNTCQARKLSVRLTTAPGTSKSRTFYIASEGVVTTLSCNITGASTTCNSGALTSTIGAGHALSIMIVSSGAPAITHALFGWECR